MSKYWMYVVCLLPLLAVMASKCESDNCTIADTRCGGNSVEVCDGTQNWAEWIDCGAISSQTGNEYVCCFDVSDDTYSCLAADKCGKKDTD